MVSLVIRRLAVALLLTLAPLAAQVTLKRGAVVYQGSGTNTTAPATVDESKLKEATPEWKKIQADGIDVDSAQGKQLIHKMNERIKEAVKSVAQSESRDLVTRKDDIIDKQGKDVVDLTDKVVDKISE
ncbi:MAG: hypothetical protein K8J09_17580 [Planctomycetes bacterium]|nr:hypothetical protein [Planctomycetota bacterium]MCC7397692.1 hypothetical protein [Planctomycetota bacterium]